MTCILDAKKNPTGKGDYRPARSKDGNPPNNLLRTKRRREPYLTRMLLAGWACRVTCISDRIMNSPILESQKANHFEHR